MRPERAPFLTGSCVYGEPNKDSDVDLVICEGWNHGLVLQLIEKLSSVYAEFRVPEPSSQKEYDRATGSLYVGKLNLIVLNEEDYDAWREGHKECIRERYETGKPVSRRRAQEIIKGRVGW